MDIESKVWEVLCSKEEIASRVKELGAEITKEYKGEKLYVISLLKGSFIFAADLIREINVPIRMGFMVTSSYGNREETSGEVELQLDITDNIEGCHVLIVDDITDSGTTMSHVVDHIKLKNPASVRSCVLLDKPDRRQVDFEADYIGFSIEDRFVVGYGLNYGEYYRDIPYVFVVTNEDRK